MDESPRYMHESPPIPWCGSYTAAKNQDFPPHQHLNGWEVVLYVAGNPTTTVDGEVLAVGPGQLVVTPPRVVHSEEALTAYANLYIGVDVSADHPWPRGPFRASEAIRQTMQELVTESVSSQLGRAEMLSSLSLRLDVLLRRAAMPESRTDPYVDALESLIQTHYAAPIDIGWLADQVGLCPSALRARCVRLGATPRDRLWKHRLSAATHLIQHSELSLETIASRCGFDSASHLSRRFRQAHGVFPGLFRQTPGQSAVLPKPALL